MNDLILSNKSEEIWRYYRSTFQGRPINIKQAYNSVYPWIEYNGVYFNRCLEICIYFLINNLSIPQSLIEDYNIIECAYHSISSGNKVFGDIAMEKPKDNKFRDSMLLIQKQISVCGDIGFDFKKYRGILYTDIYNLGGDSVISREQCFKNSYRMPVIARPDVFEDINVSINWSNVWIWEN